MDYFNAFRLRIWLRYRKHPLVCYCSFTSRHFFQDLVQKTYSAPEHQKIYSIKSISVKLAVIVWAPLYIYMIDSDRRPLLKSASTDVIISNHCPILGYSQICIFPFFNIINRGRIYLSFCYHADMTTKGLGLGLGLRFNRVRFRV